MLSQPLVENWTNLISVGLRPEMDHRVRIQLLSVNAFAVIAIGLVSIFAIVFLWFGSPSVIEGLFIIPLMAMTMFLNAQQKFNAAKFLIVFVTLFTITGLAVADRRIGTEYLLIAVACSSALFYESLRSIILALGTAGLCYGFYAWYDANHPFVADPSMPYGVIRNLILLLSVSAVFTQFLIVRYLLNKYATRLKHVNERIRINNEDLLTNNNRLDEIAKKKSKELQSYVDAIDVNIFSLVTDANGNILKVNQPLLDVSGFTEQELLGKSVTLFDSGHHSKSFFKNLIRHISTGNIWRGELNSNNKFGKHFWVDMVIMPIAEDDQKPKQFLILSLPINERKSAEAERENIIRRLQKSEARYRAMVENQSDFISLSDADGTLVFVNETYGKFTGLPISEMRSVNNRADMLTMATPFTVKLQMMENASGERRWIHWRHQALFDETGKLFEQLSVGRDVTELKEAESQKVNHLQSLERIAFETSHSIRGPLARILGLIYLVDKNAVRRSELISVVDKLKTCAGELDQSTRDLDHFVNERQDRLRIQVNPGQSPNRFDGGPSAAAYPTSLP